MLQGKVRKEEEKIRVKGKESTKGYIREGRRRRREDGRLVEKRIAEG